MCSTWEQCLWHVRWTGHWLSTFGGNAIHLHTRAFLSLHCGEACSVGGMTSTSGRQSGSADSDTLYQTLPLSSTPKDVEMMPPPTVPRALTSKCRRTSMRTWHRQQPQAQAVWVWLRRWNLSSLVKLSCKAFFQLFFTVCTEGSYMSESNRCALSQAHQKTLVGTLAMAQMVEYCLLVVHCHCFYFLFLWSGCWHGRCTFVNLSFAGSRSDLVWLLLRSSRPKTIVEGLVKF